MRIEFDPDKNAWNIRQRDLSGAFDFGTAIYAVDNRRDYGETRIRALGYLDNRLHALVFVEVAQGIRIISFRKANQREEAHYESQTQI